MRANLAIKWAVSRILKSLTQVMFLAIPGLSAFPSIAGTVITTNLPPNTAIVNIDARADGAEGFNSGESFWYTPFNTSGSLLTYGVSAGVYSFRVVDAADAAQLFPALTSVQTNEIYTAWTYNTPWTEDYLVFGSGAINSKSIPEIFDGASTNIGTGGPFYGNASSAYEAVIQNGSYDEIRVGGRASTVFTNSYTFAMATNLVFVIPDYDLADNGGGVSVVVTKIGELASGAPTLHISQSGGALTIYWQNVAGWSLYQSGNLTSPSGWSAAGGVTSANGTNYLNIATPIGNLFFRLSN